MNLQEEFNKTAAAARQAFPEALDRLVIFSLQEKGLDVAYAAPSVDRDIRQ